MTPPFALLIATKLIGASCAASVALLDDAEALALADALGDSEAFGVVAASLDDLLERAKIARTRIPTTTRIKGVGELFFTGALGVETAEAFAGAGVEVTAAVEREGTGGI